MRKLLIIITVVLVTSPCFSQDHYEWGYKDYPCTPVKQKYDTWCFFASLSTIFRGPQCMYATSYYVGFRNAHYRTDCCNAEGTTDFIVCTDNEIFMKDVVKFMNMLLGGGTPETSYSSIIYGQKLEPGKYKNPRMFPTIGFFGIGTVRHAVALFSVEVFNYNTKNEYWIYEYVDPFTGTRNFKPESSMQLVVI